MTSLLLDIGPLSCGCTDHTLEALYKSLADPPADEGIWEPHHSPYLREPIEDVTRRGQAILLAIQNDLLAVIGSNERPETLAKADKPWERWDQAAFTEALARLNSKPSSDFGLDDWMLLVDVIIQQYLPDRVIQTEAEYLAVRSAIMGQVQANMGMQQPDPSVIERIAMAVPTRMVAAKHVFGLSDADLSRIEFAKTRAAELITNLGEDLRHKIKQTLIDYQQKIIIGDPAGTTDRLASRLLDEFGDLNRDWRRIAVTESGRNTNEGYVASLPEGARVRRVEAYADACPFCRSIHGRVVRVVPASKPEKNGDTEIWIGKTNEGRSASPRKRVGNALVERMPSEMWWIAAGVQHPMCRGSWTPASNIVPGANPQFARWLEQQINASKP